MLHSKSHQEKCQNLLTDWHNRKFRGATINQKTPCIFPEQQKTNKSKCKENTPGGPAQVGGEKTDLVQIFLGRHNVT